MFLLGGWLAGVDTGTLPCGYLHSIYWYGLYVLSLAAGSIGLWVVKRQTSQNPKRKTYAWHRLAYTAIIPVLLLAVLSGLECTNQLNFTDCWFVWRLAGTANCSLYNSADSADLRSPTPYWVLRWEVNVWFSQLLVEIPMHPIQVPVARCYAANFYSSLDFPAWACC